MIELKKGENSTIEAIETLDYWAFHEIQVV